MTADGKIASSNRVISSFSSPQDSKQLLHFRSTADAVAAGARTVDLNSINLGPGPVKFRSLRKRRGLAEYNLRVIISGSGSVNPKAEIFKHRFSPILILTTERAPINALKRLRVVADEVKICGNCAIDFNFAFRWLREKWQVKRLLCEGGGEINDALFASGLVNELNLTICPIIFGGQNAPTIADGHGCQTLSLASRLHLKSLRRVGAELFLVYDVAPADSTHRANSHNKSDNRFR